jgi:hypothetical protein
MPLGNKRLIVQKEAGKDRPQGAAMHLRICKLSVGPNDSHLRGSGVEGKMRKRVVVLALVFVFGFGLLAPAKSPKQHLLPVKLFAAKSVYFDNETGFAAVGADAIRELKRWGRFQVVRSRDRADLVFVLSSEEYAEEVDDLGPANKTNFEPDWFLHFHYRPANAYLTVIDTITGETLWAGSHVWGGLLTGFNSAGRRLVHRLRKQVDPQ